MVTPTVVTPPPPASPAKTRRGTTAPPPGSEKNLTQLRYNRKSNKKPWDDIPIPLRIFYVLDRGGLPDVDAPWIFQQLRNFIVRLNVILTIVQTLAIVLAYEPTYYDGGRNSTFFAVNVVCTLFFTVDLVARIICAPERLKYALTMLNVVEVAGLVPFWIDVSGVLWTGLSQWLLILRVGRLIRWLLYMDIFEVISGTIAESSEIAALFLMIAAITLPVVGTTVYYAERGQQYPNATGDLWIRPCDITEPCTYEESPFQYASDGMFLAMMTITTLGPTNGVPNTTLGKFICGACMVIGVMVLSFPVMILSVNFAHESDRIRARDHKLQGRRCAHLQSLQREYAKQIDFEAKKSRKSFAQRESIAYGDPTAMMLIPSRVKPMYFTVPDSNGEIREAILFAATEARYDPLLMVKRDDRGVIALDQNKKKKTEFRFTVLLGSPEASKACQRQMMALLPPGSPRVSRSRHFHVSRVHFGLEVPSDNGDFLKSLRLLRGYDDQVEANRMQVDGTLELYGLANVDDGHVQEVAAALSRCRLLISASVVRSDPVHYEIPFFYEMLASTSLALVLKSRKKRTGLVYCTHSQVVNLIYGIHNIFQIPLEVEIDEEVHIVNIAEISNTIATALLRECAVEVDEVDAERVNDFLHPVVEQEKDESGKPVKYFGLIPYKISGRSEKSAYLDQMFGFALGTKSKEEEDEARMSRMLCSVIVKAVRVRQMHRVEQL